MDRIVALTATANISLVLRLFIGPFNFGTILAAWQKRRAEGIAA
jgi:hypothetical protein